MKKHLLICILMLLIASNLFSQPTKKIVTKQKPPTQSEMDKSMEDAMKGMSEEDKVEMRKMMKDVMPDMVKKPGSDLASFTDNKTLAPVKDVQRINSISKKVFTDADI